MKILPDEIPDNPVPLDASTLIEVSSSPRVISTAPEEGKNMFVSLLTGHVFVGRIEWVDGDHFTVGQSDPIYYTLVESFREV